MAASGVTWDRVKTSLDAARTAVSAGNYTEARKQLAMARLDRAGVEDSAAANGTTASMDKAFKDILELIDDLEAEKGQDDDDRRRVIYGRTNFS